MAKGAVQSSLGTIQNWLPGIENTSWDRLRNDRTPDRRGEETLQNPQETPSCRVSSPQGTLCAGLDLVSSVAAFTPGGALGKEDAVHMATTYGHEGAMDFATLQDKPEQLGEIFCPMSAEEQGENRRGWVPAPSGGLSSSNPSPRR